MAARSQSRAASSSRPQTGETDVARTTDCSCGGHSRDEAPRATRVVVNVNRLPARDAWSPQAREAAAKARREHSHSGGTPSAPSSPVKSPAAKPKKISKRVVASLHDEADNAHTDAIAAHKAAMKGGDESKAREASTVALSKSISTKTGLPEHQSADSETTSHLRKISSLVPLKGGKIDHAAAIKAHQDAQYHHYSSAEDLR